MKELLKINPNVKDNIFIKLQEEEKFEDKKNGVSEETKEIYKKLNNMLTDSVWICVYY